MGRYEWTPCAFYSFVILASFCKHLARIAEVNVGRMDGPHNRIEDVAKDTICKAIGTFALINTSRNLKIRAKKSALIILKMMEKFSCGSLLKMVISRQ
jgi:hypothetical protein